VRITISAAREIIRYTWQFAASKHSSKRSPYCAPEAPVIASVIVLEKVGESISLFIN
jgi:hypothetical protein